MPFDINQLLLEEMSDAIIAHSPVGRVVFWSRGEVFGCVANELLRTSLPQPMEDMRCKLITADHWGGELYIVGRPVGKTIDSGK